MGNSSPSSSLGRNFSPAHITELSEKGGESRNIFLTLHWNTTSWELCSRRWLADCAVLYSSRGITQQAPNSAITGETPESTLFSRLDGRKITYPFAKDCISFLTVSWSRCGAESLAVQSPGLSYCKDSGNFPEVLKPAVAHTAEHLGVNTHKTKAIPQASFCQHRPVQFQERSHHCQDTWVHHCYGKVLQSFNLPFSLCFPAF